jgi:hypothetical protein
MSLDVKRRWSFTLRALLVVTVLAGSVAYFARPRPPRLVEGSLVGMSERDIVAEYGPPTSNQVGYSQLGLEPEPPPAPEPIRTLIIDHVRGGTLWVWLKDRGSHWECFKSCWFADGLQF